jgi:purine-binding chemotaxis protein CheW
MDPTLATETARPATQYLTFSLLGEEYAVGILKVREILEYDVVTRVPRAPAWVRGAINLRGRVVPVLDLAVRFGMPPQEISRRTCIVILDLSPDHATRVVGILVDSVSQVVDLRDEDIAPAPTFGTKVRPDELLGVAPMGKKFALILDVDRVLSWSETVVTETAAAEAVAAADLGQGVNA